MKIPLQYYFSLFNSHSHYLRLTRDSYQLDDSRITRNKNYQPSRSVWRLSDPFSDEIDGQTAPFNEQCRAYLMEIIDLCREKNVPLLMTAFPYDVSVEERIVLNEIEQIAQDNGIDYLSMETLVEEAAIDWENDFMDRGHTNYMGAHKLTDFFGYYLTSWYEMTDRSAEDLPDSPFLQNAYGYLAEEAMLTNEFYPMTDYLESLYSLDDSYLLLFSTGKSRGRDLTDSQRSALENLGFRVPTEGAFDLMQINEGFEMLCHSTDPTQPIFTSIDAHSFKLDCQADDPVWVDLQAASAPSENSRLLIFDRYKHEVIDSVAFGDQNESVGR